MLTRFYLFLVLALSSIGTAQQTERPGHSESNPIDLPKDLSGLSIKVPRLRIVHTDDPSLEGGSMYLQKVDPWLAYEWGRSLFQREFRKREGFGGESGKLDGPLLADGATHMASRGHVNSCATCHSNPYRDAGAGTTISKNGGQGRNTPHLFGQGLIEMLGRDLQQRITSGADVNGDGWISREEAEGKVCRIVPGGKTPALDFGCYDDRDNDGKPDLNDIVHPVFVDGEGKRIAFATGLDFGGVAGYRIEVQVFGYGHLYLPNRPPLPTTLRTFNGATLDIHMGLQPHDPTVLEDKDGDGFSQISNAGLLQPLSQAGRDRGRVKSENQWISRDDPDRDGFCEEISEGDMDVMEWYCLNHPAPGRGRITKSVVRGEKLFERIGCAQCHVSDWQLESADRRFFDLEVAFNGESGRLEGKLNPVEGNTRVKGIYSDFRYHDMGPEFEQVQFDGSVVRQWRTTPLWGVAHSGPYGHDGENMSLDSVIRRHGGEGAAARTAYGALTANEQDELLAFLRSLVLYQTSRIPVDVNGDGVIESNFKVAGMDTGMERLNPEWLFRVPGKIEGPVVNHRGWEIVSYALTNRDRAYGLHLPYMKDSDGDGFPDVRDLDPELAGYRDGSK